MVVGNVRSHYFKFKLSIRGHKPTNVSEVLDLLVAPSIMPSVPAPNIAEIQDELFFGLGNGRK
jgi:hypothetical protein